MTNQILLACIYLAVFLFLQRALTQWVKKLSLMKQVSAARTSLVTRFISYVMFFITLSLMAVSLGLGYQDVSLFVSSAFAVMGVALVAQWSILSNLTAGVRCRISSCREANIPTTAATTMSHGKGLTRC